MQLHRRAAAGPVGCRGPALAPRRPAHIVARPAAAAAGGSTAVSVASYLARGPRNTAELDPITFNVGQGSSGPLDCTIRVTVPSGQPPPSRWPVGILSAGFLLASGLYSSYASDFASWGMVTVLYDLPEVVDDDSMVAALGRIVDTCTRDPRLSPHVDPRAVLLAGHSRGAKVSVLAAARDPRIRGTALLDPVDANGMTPAGPGYPSALPALRSVSGAPRRLPVLVVGAALNGDVVPADAGYRRFLAAAQGGPCVFVELTGAGHLQFLDAQLSLFAMFSKGGSTSDEVVRAVSKAAVLAWALELAVPLARGEEVSGSQAMERLQQTAVAIERLAPISYSIKGFSHLSGAPSSSSAGRSQDDAPPPPPEQPRAAQSGFEGARGSSGRSERPRGTWDRDELLSKRAKELKAILVERGVDASDCFEKADLVQRILERC